MSIGQSAVMLCSWGVKAGTVRSIVDACRWQVKLCDPSLTRAKLSALKMSIAHIIKRYRNVLSMKESELTVKDPQFFFNYLRMEPAMFDELAQRVGPRIEKYGKRN